MARNQKEIIGNNVGKQFEKEQLDSQWIDRERAVMLAMHE